MNTQYYLIHGIDKSRGEMMKADFLKYGLDNDKVKWINHPNKDELTNELIDSIIIKEPSYSCGVLIPPEFLQNHRGRISCAYKHYLALKDIVENRYDYGVIIEDNIHFTCNIPEMVNSHINELDKLYPNDWDIIFDCDWIGVASPPFFCEYPINKDVHVYKKSNEVTRQCQGGTKSATFYLLTYKCAKILYENYLPFNANPDWIMNDLFRKFNIKSFWVEPYMVKVHDHHISTTSNN